MANPTSSFLNQLGTLSETAHFFLNEQNRNGLYKGWSYETTTTYLQQIAFNLNLVDLLSEEEINFEELLSALDQFLSSTDENQLESVVPTDVLENLKTILDEENIKNEELLEIIRTENKERLDYLKKLSEIRKRLGLKIEKPSVTEEELQKAVPKIVDKIQPEISLLVKEAQKARENEELRVKIQEKGQEIYLKAIRENNEISPAVKEYLLSREISAETVIQLAEAPITEQNTRQNEIFLNSILPPSPEEIKILEEEIIPQIAVNVGNLSPETTSDEVKEVIAVSLAQKLDDIKDFSPDKIGNLVNEILPEVQNIIAGKDKTPIFLEIPKTIANLSTEETTFLRENVLPAIAVKIPNLSSQTTPEEIKGVIWATFSQEINQTAPLRNISNERIQGFVNEIFPEVQNIIAGKDKTPTLFKGAPTIFEGKDKVFISLTSPPIPGNPQGEVYKLTDENRTLGQDFLKNLRNGTLKESFNQLKERASERISLKLTIQGVSSEELIIRASQDRLKGTVGASQKVAHLSTLSENLRLFKEKYFFRSSLPQQWIANKIKSSQIFQQISSFAKSGFTKGITSTLGKAGLQTAQKGLQTLWNTIKTGATKAITKGATAILSKIGLQALASFTLPVIGNVIAFFAPKILKGIKNGIGKIGGSLLFPIGIAKTFLGKITGNQGEGDDFKWLKFIFIGIFIIIFVVPLIGSAGVIGSAFVGGMGGDNESPGSNPSGPPTSPLIECNNTRHLSEEVICRIIQRPPLCDQAILNYSTRDEIRTCINSQADFPQKDLFSGGFYYYNCYYLEKNCPYQCLQFVQLVTNVLGQIFNSDFGSAGQYYNSPPPNYVRVTNLKAGDIVVWSGEPGHIAFYLGTVEGSQTDIMVAEANSPQDGQLHVGQRPIERRGELGHFFRYCPGGGCQ